MPDFDPAELSLCAWDDSVLEHVGPITVAAFFSDSSGSVICDPIKALPNGRVVGHLMREDEIRARVASGHATWAKTSIRPMPSHVLVLWPRDMPDNALFKRDSVPVQEITVESPARHVRKILYVAQAEAELALSRLARAFYEQSCLALGRGDLPGAANAIVSAIDAAPSFPHVYLLAAEIRLRRQPDDLPFAQSMRELAGEMLDSSVETQDMGTDLFFFERSSCSDRETLRSMSRDDVQACVQSFARLRALRWPLQLLDRSRRRWKKIASEARKLRRYDIAQSAGEVELALVRELLEAKPDEPRNHFRLAAALEIVGQLAEAATAASNATQLPAPSTAPSIEQYDFWSGIADSYRILGRARFLRKVDGDPVQALEFAREQFKELGTACSSKPERIRYLNDRLAQCELYLGITKNDEQLVDSAVKRLKELVAAARPTSSQWLLLCDAYIWQQRWVDARRALMRFEDIRRGTSTLAEKRYHLVAHRELLDQRSARPQLTEFIELLLDHQAAA